MNRWLQDFVIRCLRTVSRTENVYCVLKRSASEVFAVSGATTCNSLPGDTTSTGAVTERLHTCTEHAPVLDRPVPLRRYYAIPAPNTNAPTYILTYLMSRCQRIFVNQRTSIPTTEQRKLIKFTYGEPVPHKYFVQLAIMFEDQKVKGRGSEISVSLTARSVRCRSGCRNDT